MEAELLAVARVEVAVGAAGAAVQRRSASPCRRAQPLDEQLGIGVGAEHLLGRGVELAGHPDDGTFGSASMVVSVVVFMRVSFGVVGVSAWSFIAARTASRRR